MQFNKIGDFFNQVINKLDQFLSLFKPESAENFNSNQVNELFNTVRYTVFKNMDVEVFLNQEVNNSEIVAEVLFKGSRHFDTDIAI